ncbi:MAG TPA: TIGR03435 family protein [Bryobacteraceae bacterium]|jgi:uncharacterized protein (TIGR03435 family)
MMETAQFRLAAVLMIPCGLFAQAPGAQKLEFEAATVKPADPDRRGPVRSEGGPGSADPGRLSYPGMTLRNLLLRAFDLPPGQLAAPDWLYDTQFDVMANVPAGSTKEQVRVMLQNLLVERFKITFHHEMQDKPAFDLTVAKGGPKLKTTAYPNAKPNSSGSLQFTLDKNDFPILPKELAVQARVDWVKNGSFRSTFRAFAIADLAQSFASILTEAVPLVGNVIPRVFDKTGLTGRYDFTLEYSNFVYGRPDNDVEITGPSIFTAVEKQLGLKLEKSKAPLDMMVIDHIEKTPVAN